jgi:hypothetical protein
MNRIGSARSATTMYALWGFGAVLQNMVRRTSMPVGMTRVPAANNMPVGMIRVPAENSGSEPLSLERCAPEAMLEASALALEVRACHNIQ